ncbi:MAG: stage III sporulation protein AD [Candidatus Carbobacillus altaicus]|nr:stage III sporulation protein AD [Candidatus Carbobacillus altaicus]
MTIMQVVGVGLTATALALLVREERPLFAYFITLVATMIIFISVLSNVQKIIELIINLSQRAHVNALFTATILKIVAVAYIADFAAQISRDAGETSIAGKIELAGKVMILMMAIPILEAMIETVLALIPV